MKGNLFAFEYFSFGNKLKINYLQSNGEWKNTYDLRLNFTTDNANAGVPSICLPYIQSNCPNIEDEICLK